MMEKAHPVIWAAGWAFGLGYGRRLFGLGYGKIILKNYILFSNFGEFFIFKNNCESIFWIKFIVAHY